MELTAIYTKEPEGGYTVEILEFPGCVSYGETMEEAQKMVKEAIAGYMEAQKKIWIDVKGLVNKEKFISSMAVAYEAI